MMSEILRFAADQIGHDQDIQDELERLRDLIEGKTPDGAPNPLYTLIGAAYLGVGCGAGLITFDLGDLHMTVNAEMWNHGVRITVEVR